MRQVRLRRLEVAWLRVITAAALDVDAELVVFAGPNGSGKTSALEAIHLLAAARSFRSRSVSDVIQRQAQALRVVGRAVDVTGRAVTVGVEKQRAGATRMRIDGEPVARASELARRLPVMIITPDSQRLLSDGSEQRRRLIDWLLFHVEPDYHAAHRRYRQALRQRNGALRSGSLGRGVAEAWDHELASAGRALHTLRMRHAGMVETDIQQRLQTWSGVPVELRFHPGWNAGSEALEAMLGRCWARDRERGFTGEGPHRADIEVRMVGRLARDVLSRGESKLVTVGLQLALAGRLAQALGAAPLVLVDELASELDRRNRAAFFEALRESGAQTFVTTVDTDLVSAQGWSSAQVLQVAGGHFA